MGNTPRVSCWRRIPAKEWSPRAVNEMDLEFLGSAHGVPTDELCRRWTSMPARDPNSLLQQAHWKPNDSGNCFGPSGFPLPAAAPWRTGMLWMAFNLLQFSAGGPIDPNCSRAKTGVKHNTKRIRTALCIAIASDGSEAWMCTHHHDGRFHYIPDKNQNHLRRLNLKSMRII